MNNKITVECGAGYEKPLIAPLFAEMFKISARTVMHYQGDLYHDAIFMQERLSESGGVFVWGVRQYGTTMSFQMDSGAIRHIMRSNQDTYLVACYLRDERLGIWEATLERLDEELSDSAHLDLIREAKELCR